MIGFLIKQRLIFLLFLCSSSVSRECSEDKIKDVPLNITDCSSWETSVINGQSTSLFCCTSGYQTVLWYRQDPYRSFDEWVRNCTELNPKANPDVKLTDENQTLFFKQAELDRLGKGCIGDSGFYTCIASDGKGNSQNRTFKLIVEKCNSNIKPQALLNGSCQNKTVSTGQNASFDCTYSLCADNELQFQVNSYKLFSNNTKKYLPDGIRYNFTYNFVRLPITEDLDKIYTHLSIESINEGDYKTKIFIEVQNSAGESALTLLQVKKPHTYLSYFLPLVIGGSLVGLVLVTLAMITWWNLEFRLLLRNVIRTFPWPDDIKGKEYDGFVLSDFGYNAPGKPCENDHQFIMENLLKTVEDRWGYKLFVWQRVQDSAKYSGQDISTAIQDIMKKSRRIIILLSPNFINRGLPNITLPRVSSSLENFPRQVMIIKFEEIMTEQLDNFQLKEQLNLLSMMVKTIQWEPENQHKVERFWKKLKLGMPVHSIQEIRQRKQNNNEQQRDEEITEQTPLCNSR